MAAATVWPWPPDGESRGGRVPPTSTAFAELSEIQTCFCLWHQERNFPRGSQKNEAVSNVQKIYL